MTRRKRKHIPMIEIAACALAENLPNDLRNELRKDRIPAKEIIRWFTPDHVILHAWGGADKWWNLTMRRRGAELKAKDAADTTRVAKDRHIHEKWDPFTRAMAKGTRPPKRKSAWPKRKMRER
jgi:hypothetical protein